VKGAGLCSVTNRRTQTHTERERERERESSVNMQKGWCGILSNVILQNSFTLLEHRENYAKEKYQQTPSYNDE
jgi:hypothetical protein